MILVINTGSSSLKAKLYKSGNFEVIDSFSQADISCSNGSGHARAAKLMIRHFSTHLDQIEYVAHRIVMGGEGAIDGESVDKKSMERLSRCIPLAPLHNPGAIAVIKAVLQLVPKAKSTLVYDTSFYNSLPETETTYPIEAAICQKYGVRRFGFHGISHRYAFDISGAGKYKRVISIHLGAGSSVAAIQNGRAIATSMGLTPLGGVVMQTRCGDIDPGVVFRLIDSIGLKKARSVLESNSGLKGLCPNSSGDMLELLSWAGYKVEDSSYSYSGTHFSEDKCEYARLAIDIFCQRIKDFIGSYAARMSGVDALIFTGKIGAGSGFIRDKITYGFDFLGLKEVMVVDPDEELAIAKIINQKYY